MRSVEQSGQIGLGRMADRKRISDLRSLMNFTDTHRAARAECQRGSPSARFRNTVWIVQGPPPAKAK